MDKNTATGLVLIALLFIVFNLWVSPPPPPPQDGQIDSTGQVINADPALENQGNALADTTTNLSASDSTVNTSVKEGLFQQATGTQESFTTLENDLVILTFSNKGGRLYKTELKKYKTYQQEPLVVLDGPDNVFSFTFPMGIYTISTQDYFFEAEQNGANSVTFRLKADDNRYLQQTYTLNDGSYVVDYDYDMVGFEKGGLRNGSPIELQWEHNMRPQEKSFETEQYYTGVYFKEKNDDVNYLSETADDEKEVSLSIDWVSSKQQFFCYTVIADESFKRGNLAIKANKEENKELLETTTANLVFDYKAKPSFKFPMHLYVGPNDYSILKNLKIGDNDDLAMHELVPLGWAIFRWVNAGFIIPCFNFLHKFIGNYGVIILILTVFIKLLLFPLTYRSYKSFAKMNVLKPDIEELRAKHAKDPSKMQTEQMKLYSKAGVNPLGGCLPQLLQFPILIAMYRFFPASIELRQESFLWADDLSSYDSILSLPFDIPFYGDHVSLFCLLSAASSLIYMRLNQQMTPTTGSNEMANQMKMIQYFMPLMLLFFFNSFAAGLTYYFFLSNVISFTQQYAIKNYFIDEDKLRQQIQANKKKPSKKSKFQQRLETMVKAQQEQQRMQQQQKGSKKRR